MNTNYSVINDFDPDKYNILIPVQSLQEISPIYKIVVNQVSISTKIEDGEIYHEKNAPKVNNQDMYALTARALMKLSTAANVQIIDTRKVKPKACEKCIDIVAATKIAPACGNCPCSANVAFAVTMKFPELSGGWREIQATKEYDFGHVTASRPGQIAKMKEHAAEQVETKAFSRCIRKGLSIKSAYTLQELAKPFIVAYPVLDARDADVKKALIAGAVASSNLLYNKNIMQLDAPKQYFLPDEITGNTHVEQDYDVETPYISEMTDMTDMIDTSDASDALGTSDASDTSDTLGISNKSNNTEESTISNICHNPNCKKPITDKIAKYSTKLFGQAFCYECQKYVKENKKQ